MGFFRYIYLRVLATLVRTIVKLGTRTSASPDEVLHIPSRDRGRTIRAHIYKPRRTESKGVGNNDGGDKPSPLLLNFHGSGFMIPLHGSDDEFCRKISQETTYTVIDLSYRLAPEHPFPAALHDVEDAVTWALSQDDKYDLSQLSISGFSAGANLALAVASSSRLIPTGTFHSLLAIYPVLDLCSKVATKKAPTPGRNALPAPVARLFHKCYIPPGVDKRDPRISPCFANPETFPHRILVVTAACDTLALEAERFAADVGKLPGRYVVCERMEGCEHGWDKRARKGTAKWEAKEKAYALAVDMLRG